jgi:protein O-mannosyl-transferase
MNKIIRTKSALAISIAVITFLVYLASLRNDFVNWDDDVYVYENPFIRSLDMQLLKSAFAGFYASYWCPLTWLSHAVDYAIWGLNPLGHHLTNNILHALNTFLVVLLVMKLMAVLKKTAEHNAQSQPVLNDSTILITGAVTGLLFGLHPLHVESVAWVAERKDLLCAFFFLLTIITYTAYASESNISVSPNAGSRYFNKKYLFAVGFFILSLLSKPMAVSLPIVLLILDWYPFGRIQSLKTFRIAFIEKLPFIFLSLISSILTILAQKVGGATFLMQRVPLPTRLLIAAKSLITYMWKMVLPLNLIPYYPHPETISPLSLEYIIPIISVTGITLVCFAVMRKQKLWIAVWSYYVITLVPVLGIIQVGGQSMANRFTYLPSLGPFIIVGLLTAKVYEKVTVFKRWKTVSIIVCLFIALAMIVSISYATIEQIGIWKNGIIFWNYVISKEPWRAPGAYNNLGNAYLSKGQLDMAIEQYQTALNLKPDYLEAYNNLGVAYSSIGQQDMAIKQFQIALSLQPNFAEAHFNLGHIYLNNGIIDMARREYELGLKNKPDDYEARQVLNSIVSK